LNRQLLRTTGENTISLTEFWRVITSDMQWKIFTVFGKTDNCKQHSWSVEVHFASCANISDFEKEIVLEEINIRREVGYLMD
jgi:hypothetical protein